MLILVVHVFVISGFCRDDEICALLGYYTASNGRPLPVFRNNVSVPSWRVKKSVYRSHLQGSRSPCPLKIVLIRSSKTSVKVYHFTLCNIPEECRSYAVFIWVTEFKSLLQRCSWWNISRRMSLHAWLLCIHQIHCVKERPLNFVHWRCSIENDSNEICAITVTAVVVLPAGIFTKLMFVHLPSNFIYPFHLYVLTFKLRQELTWV
jgi:hypothetical protein